MTKAEQNYEDRKRWFADRVGKRVFRNKTSCPCKTCKNVHENGLIIEDIYSASYLHDIEAEFSADGNPTQYFDTKEEAIQFEEENKPENIANKLKKP